MISPQRDVVMWRHRNTQLDNSGSQQLDDFSRTRRGNTALLFNSIFMRLVNNILSSPQFFLYILFLTEESTNATEPTFSLWNTSLLPRYYQMPLTPLLGLVTEDNFLHFFKLSNLFFKYMTEHSVWGETCRYYLSHLLLGTECLQTRIRGYFLIKWGKNHFSHLVLKKHLLFAVIQVAS